MDQDLLEDFERSEIEFDGDSFCRAERFDAFSQKLGDRFVPTVLPDEAAGRIGWVGVTLQPIRKLRVLNMFKTDDVHLVDQQIQRVGSAMLFSAPVIAKGAEEGIDDPVQLYAGGRGGVLGDVSWQQVHSAFGFFPSEIVKNAWDGVRTTSSPKHFAETFAAGLAETGRSLFPDTPATEVAELGGLVIESVTPLGMALFTGWRAMPRPSDGPGAAALAIMTLRELRGDVHLQDVAAAGIEPIEAEVVVRGVDGLGLHGWQPPFPDPEASRAAVAAATETTTARMAGIYDQSLSDEQFARFTAAVSELSEAQAAA